MEATLAAEGVEQTAGYADQCGADEAYLIIFDRRPDVDWDDKIWQQQEQWQARRIEAWGM